MSKLRIIRVARMVVTDTSNVLLVKQMQRERRWELPGGKVRAVEGYHAAAARELYEETNFQADNHQMLCDVRREQCLGDDLRVMCRTKFFICHHTAPSRPLHPDQDEIEKVAWVGVNQVEKMPLTEMAAYTWPTLLQALNASKKI